MGLYGSAPTPPDPKETASAQTASNVGTAVANSIVGNVNQVTPYGSLTYSQTGTQKWTDPNSGKIYDLPVTTATQTLSPQQQAIADKNQNADLNLASLAASQSGRLNDILSNPFTLNGAPAAGDVSGLKVPQYTQFGAAPQLQGSFADVGDITRSYGTDYSENVRQVQDAMMARLQPSLTESRQAVEQQLANQGVMPGSEAYNRAIDAATRQENDARLAVITNAGQEQNRLASLAQQQAQFQNSAQQQAYSQAQGRTDFQNAVATQNYQNQNSAAAANNALADQSFNSQQALINAQNAARANYLNEQYAARNQPINEISSLLSGAQVTSPNFIPAQGPTVANTDYAGIINQGYQNKLDAYKANQTGSLGLLGALTGYLPGSYTKASDRRVKKDVKKIGGLYEYRYKGEGKDAPKRIGVMAQEVEKVRPEVVMTGQDGIKRVNYGRLFEARPR
ncbi:tail fiber domain-containing protein [Oryzifoliimicrobium ureilyticus]|uniref:tail fiber domain-containing protein n=1 Tax=Oryzifoliimicrobium ureilyticus TaxID=3113724 RepID=UPI0030766F64